MSAQNMMVSAVNADGKWLYRAGGIAALILVIGYFLTFPVYASVGTQPSGAEAQLSYFAEQAAGWWVIIGLMVFTDLLYIPVWLALYQALKEINRNAMLLAIACVGLFVALDLAVTWTAYSSILILGGSYAAATSDTQRAIFVAAAGYPSTVLDSPLLAIYAILIPSLGFLFTGPVMAKGGFGKSASFLSWAVGISGIVAVAGPYFASALGMMRIVNALLATIWFLLVGWRLYRIGR
jgi:hypothetical protein